jgi:phage replication O-like protein O
MNNNNEICKKNLIYECNYTSIPNVIFDYWMEVLTPAEFKVLLCICRKTFGWHKYEDKISLKQIEKLTNLSRKGIIKCISKLVEFQLVIKISTLTESGDNAINLYSIDVNCMGGGSVLSSPGGSVLSSPGGGVLSSPTKERVLQKKDSLQKKDMCIKENYVKEKTDVVVCSFKNNGLSQVDSKFPESVTSQIKNKVSLWLTDGIEKGFISSVIDIFNTTAVDEVYSIEKWFDSVLGNVLTKSKIIDREKSAKLDKQKEKTKSEVLFGKTGKHLQNQKEYSAFTKKDEKLNKLKKNFIQPTEMEIQKRIQIAEKACSIQSGFSFDGSRISYRTKNNLINSYSLRENSDYWNFLEETIQKYTQTQKQFLS